MLLQDADGAWWYYFFGASNFGKPFASSASSLGGKGNSRIIFEKIEIDPDNVIGSLNDILAKDALLDDKNRIYNYMYTYEEALFAKGDYGKSIELAQKQKASPENYKYDLLSHNCMHASMEVLLESELPYALKYMLTYAREKKVGPTATYYFLSMYLK